MSLKTDVGRIRFELLRKGWIVPTAKTSGLLLAIVKREGVDRFRAAIKVLEKKNYEVYDRNDITSKITILYLANICKKLPENPGAIEDPEGLMKDIIKDVVDD